MLEKTLFYIKIEKTSHALLGLALSLDTKEKQVKKYLLPTSLQGASQIEFLQTGRSHK